jgi:hypothetical protein
VRPVRHIRFPPKWRLVLVPESPRAASALGVTLYTASKPAPLAAQRALWAVARVFGGRALPGPREQWAPPLPAGTFAALCDQLRASIGREPDGYAIYERPQRERAGGLTMLACAGRASLLVRARTDAAELAIERRVSAAYAAHPATAFRVPRLAGAGELDGWHWVAYETIATRPHAPVRRAPGRLFDDVGELVEAALDRPAGTPEHWRGAHGDLTPWNLRRSGTGTWLIDWEDAGWAPPGSDRVYFAAVTAATGGGPARPIPVADEHQEAAQRWAAVVADRPAGEDARLRDRLLAALRG